MTLTRAALRTSGGAKTKFRSVDVVVAVSSRGARRRDRIDQRDLYERHGVREYWLVDPEARTVEVRHRESGTCQVVGRGHRGERARSRPLEGFQVPVAQLLGEAGVIPVGTAWPTGDCSERSRRHRTPITGEG